MAQGFVELNPDQRRELVNTRQRFQVWQEALARQAASRGSLVWSSSKGHEYLLRSAYDRQGQRRQVSLGLRSPETERVKAEFDRSKTEADERLRSLRPVLQRQAAVNRALGLGRVPLIGARIMRALDRAGLLGQGVRVLGTHSVYAYEAAAGVLIDPDYTTTEDIDLLLDARGGLSFIAGEDLEQASLLRLLQKVDRSFRRARQSYRAVNDDGYLVDLIKPLRNPPWSKDHAAIGDDPGDLEAVEIEGLIASDPRVELSAVIGLPHPKWDERPLLAVKLRAGCEATADEMLAILEGRIARWWTPDEVVFVEDIPLGATGKVDKKLVRSRFAGHTLASIKAEGLDG